MAEIFITLVEYTLQSSWSSVKYRLCNWITHLLNKKLIVNNTATIRDIEVIHQSPHYIIVNKHYDVLINSNCFDDKVTVQAQVRRLFPKLANPRLGHEFLFIHRLDFATSGLLCIPVHKAAAGAATKCFAQRKVDKYYLAIVRGLVSKEMVDIYLPIGEDMRPEWRGLRMTTSLKPYAGKCRTAHTRLLILQKGLYNNYPATKVLLKPISGRRHQLRVHLSESGHTIVGDFTYSNRKDISPFRMYLHAFRLVIPSEFEYLDFRTKDPFTSSESRNKWRPIVTLNEINEKTFEKLKHGRKKQSK
ncbi:RNA pseudouridylate synthase domain-containing protein 1-like isoform X2 [Oratosquilla oratoria]